MGKKKHDSLDGLEHSIDHLIEVAKMVHVKNVRLKAALNKVKSLAADTVEMQMTGGSLEEAIINAQLIMEAIKEREDEL